MFSMDCFFCKKEFKYTPTPSRPGRTKYCSIPCQRKGRPQNSWRSMTNDEQINRMKENFNLRVIRHEDACWEWSGSFKDGYGTIKKHKKNYLAHRFSWEQSFGPIPNGLYVCHSCDNRQCTKPGHLFLGTHKDNMADMIGKKRNRGATGENNRSAVLNEELVAIIKYMLLNNKSPFYISNNLNVSRNAIYAIKYNHTWKHVLPAINPVLKLEAT